MRKKCKWCDVNYENRTSWTHNEKTINENFCSRKCYSQYLDSGGKVTYSNYKWLYLILALVGVEIILSKYTEYSLIPIFTELVKYIFSLIKFLFGIIFQKE